MITVNEIRKQVEAQGAELCMMPITDIKVNARCGVTVKIECKKNEHRTDVITIDVVDSEEYKREYQDELNRH